MKRVFKYGTGWEIPEGAEYLCSFKNGDMVTEGTVYPPNYQYVWHYFLVEIPDETNT
jgi:hypothetical protein